MKNECGQIYAIQLSDGSFTLAQLCNTYQLGKRTSNNTFAFFNIKINLIEELDLNRFDFNDPFAIATINGTIRQYGWILVGNRPISYINLFINEIDSTGDYKGESIDPSIFLEPYFGLFPWDGYYKDDFINENIFPDAKLRSDIKFMKDFSTNELIKIMPSNNIKLISRLESEKS